MWATVRAQGIVNTGLLKTSSDIPEAQGAGIDGMAGRDGDANSGAYVGMFQDNWEQGMTAAFCGEQVFAHLADGRFYCLLMDNSATYVKPAAAAAAAAFSRFSPFDAVESSPQTLELNVCVCAFYQIAGYRYGADESVRRNDDEEAD